MSLFPAYQIKNTPSPSKSPELEIINEPNTSWLTNSSFQPEIIPGPRIILLSSDSSDCEVIDEVTEKKYETVSVNSDVQEVDYREHKPHHHHHHHHKKHKKSKKHKKDKDKDKRAAKYQPVVENLYYEDLVKDKSIYKVDTLCPRARPRYFCYKKTLGFVAVKKDKKTVVKRYFAKNLDEKETKAKTKLSSVIQRHKIVYEESDEFKEKIMRQEEEKKSKIKYFNEQLAEDPHNVDLWLEYINFGDRDNEFMTTYDQKETESLTYTRKLAIVEKALDKNSDSKQLLKAKLLFLGELLPADEYTSKIEQMISKDPGNIVLWQALITATRSSVALCTVPRVVNLYTKCFESLHLWPRAHPKTYDERLLKMMYHSVVFLRHAGLWEQMWEALRLNLNLNLNISKEHAHLKGSVDEKKLIDMEEVILTSQLPLNQLWLRVELLRENSHWTSVSRDQLELIGDSHRFITPEDVTEFVHPLLNKNSHFKMSIYILLGLKIPLLPTRHYFMQELGLDESNWTFESCESLIPMLYPCAGEMAGYHQRELLARGLLEAGLTSGPQYLRYHPARDAYLDFIRDAFRMIAESFGPDEDLSRTSIYIWWLRFERMLLSMQKNDPVKTDKSVKKLKVILKDFLKRDENRNNLHYYREYALVEREMGRVSNCVNILETAIQTKGNNPEACGNQHERAALMSLYRTLLEVLLDVKMWDQLKPNTSHITKVLCAMTNESLVSTEKYLYTCYQDFVDNSKEHDQVDHQFLPNFHCDAIACYVYLLFITNHQHQEIFQVFDTCLESSEKSPSIHERFYETKISFLQLMCELKIFKYSALEESLKRACESYPNNFYLLSVYAGIESELPHWSICLRSVNNCEQRLWPTIAECLAGRARLYSTICLNDSTARTAALNRLVHFHNRLLRVTDVRCCPLVWRLYMLLLREENLCEKKGEQVYHQSISNCPWARCIYIDAAEIAPQLLTQIQDVIREKDLRMHVTPEELDILRG
ncbi:nuclear exosome regulator NRDE2 [Microplitis mediator]|uniref:nuclear exosome regulator NRDE2 n=1 Tax=Microplitis mediator TaxID=375433 RepID=UPI0025569034|nr:nuclear exosome regulator NRDE2 [Microplitis mediator]